MRQYVGDNRTHVTEVEEAGLDIALNVHCDGTVVSKVFIDIYKSLVNVVKDCFP